jgi:hypothetical protein
MFTRVDQIDGPRNRGLQGDGAQHGPADLLDHLAVGKTNGLTVERELGDTALSDGFMDDPRPRVRTQLSQ